MYETTFKQQVKRKRSRLCPILSTIQPNNGPPIIAETLNEDNIKARNSLKRKLDCTVNTNSYIILDVPS